jgi:hypothetical protein
MQLGELRVDYLLVDFFLLYLLLRLLLYLRLLFVRILDFFLFLPFLSCFFSDFCFILSGLFLFRFGLFLLKLGKLLNLSVVFLTGRLLLLLLEEEDLIGINDSCFFLLLEINVLINSPLLILLACFGIGGLRGLLILFMEVLHLLSLNRWGGTPSIFMMICRSSSSCSSMYF